MYSWTYDVNDNVLKNHALSNDLYETALANSVAMPYVEVQSEFGRNKGESLTVTRFQHIAEPASAEVSELSPLPEVTFSISTAQFVIKEYGVAVPYTGKLEMLAHFNIENAVQRTLMEQKRLVLDTLALNSFTNGANVKYVPTGATTKSVTYNGTPSGTAQEQLNYFHVEDISALMFDTLVVPYWDGDVYIGIFRAKTLTTLRRDSQFVSWNQYTNPGAKAKGEVGIIERIKLIETNHAQALPYVGTNNFGQGVVFGKDAVGMIEALAPELRAALPSNFGRFKSIAWYGLLGFNAIFTGMTTQADSVGKARIVHVTSA
jgi:N4-gp56 family major capsid protein